MSLLTRSLLPLQVRSPYFDQFHRCSDPILAADFLASMRSASAHGIIVSQPERGSERVGIQFFDRDR